MPQHALRLQGLHTQMVLLYFIFRAFVIMYVIASAHNPCCSTFTVDPSSNSTKLCEILAPACTRITVSGIF